MSDTTDVFGELLKDQAARERVAFEAWEREQERLAGLATHVMQHGMGPSAVARATGKSRVTIYSWLHKSIAADES